MEIERKFLLKEIPKNLSYEIHSKIEQAYITNGTYPEVRIRKSQNLDGPYPYYIFHYITFKSQGDIQREEVEFPISGNIYDQILKMINKSPIIKDYYVFKDEKTGYNIEVSSIDDGKFIYAEVEFNSIDEAVEYEFPIEDVMEITGNPDYKMSNYWFNTRF